MVRFSIVKLQKITLKVYLKNEMMDLTLFNKHRKEVAAYMRRVYDRHLTTASGGNVSERVGNYIVITPSATDKGTIKGNQTGVMDMAGKMLTGNLKPSIESNMHLEIYKIRPDVKAIVHAHPPVASTFTAMDIPINCALIAESRMVLGEPVTVPYQLMGTRELAMQTAVAAKGKHNIILLRNHGIVCLGTDLLSAFDRLEVLEAAAKMTVVAKIMGMASPLNGDQLSEIDRLIG